MPKLRLHAWSVHGTLCVKDQKYADRNRHTRVAEVRNTGTGALAMPALHDVVLVGSFGESWTFSGFERITAGPLGETYFVAQAWLVTPGPHTELEAAERKLAQVYRELAELKAGKTLD